MSFRIDQHTQYVPGGDEVDHAATAKANLGGALDDVKRMRLDKTLDALKIYAHGAALRDLRDLGYEVEESPALIALKGLALLPVGMARDAAEIAVGPLLAVKDLAEAAWHGILSAFKDG